LTFVNKDELIVFISYAMKDSDFYQIPYIAEELKTFPNISDVFYCEADVHDDFIEYMNEYVPKCNVFIMFCSENASLSRYVKLEWQMALNLNKKIIPVFIDQKYIPPILLSCLGIDYNQSETYDELLIQIHDLILKKMEIPSNGVIYINNIYEDSHEITYFDEDFEIVQSAFELLLELERVMIDLYFPKKNNQEDPLKALMYGDFEDCFDIEFDTDIVIFMRGRYLLQHPDLKFYKLRDNQEYEILISPRSIDGYKKIIIDEFLDETLNYII